MVMTKFNKPEFIYTTYINTTPERLWEALTNSEFTQKYFFGLKVESDWKVGSKISYINSKDGIDTFGTILEFQPNKKLTYTFENPHDKNIREKPTEVTFEIKQVNDFVRLTLTHTNLIDADLEENPNTMQGLNNGWPAIITNLKNVIETGKIFDFSSLFPVGYEA